AAAGAVRMDLRPGRRAGAAADTLRANPAATPIWRGLRRERPPEGGRPAAEMRPGHPADAGPRSLRPALQGAAGGDAADAVRPAVCRIGPEGPLILRPQRMRGLRPRRIR